MREASLRGLDSKTPISGLPVAAYYTVSRRGHERKMSAGRIVVGGIRVSSSKRKPNVWRRLSENGNGG